MGIDPHNLGPRVYKEDQVLTRQNFEYLIKIYKKDELILMEAGYFEEAMKCCAAHSVLEHVKKWVDKGKPGVK